MLDHLDFRGGEGPWSTPKRPDHPGLGTKFDDDEAYEYVSDSWQRISNPVLLRYLAEFSNRVQIGH